MDYQSMTGLMLFVLLLTVNSYSAQIVLDESTVRLQSHVSRARVKHGEMLVYTYDIKMNSSSNVQSVTLIINGSNLEIVDTPVMANPDIVWENKDGQTLEPQNSPRPMLQLSMYEFSVKVPSVFRKHHLDNISGSVTFRIAETAPLGCLLRPFVYVLMHSKHTLLDTSHLFGDYVFLHLPTLAINRRKSGLGLDMKDKVKVESRITVPVGPMEASVFKVFMPSNITVSPPSADIYRVEPFLTATDVQVVRHGEIFDAQTLADDDEAPDKPQSNFLSNSKTSENDAVVITVPSVVALDQDGGQTSESIAASMDVSVEVSSLDFVNATKDRDMVTVHVLEVCNTGFYMVQNMTLSVERRHTVPLEPHLGIRLQLKIDQTDSQTNLDFMVNLWHEEDSWGSAYDVDVLFYTPVYLTAPSIEGAGDAIRLYKRLIETVDNNLVVLRLERASFAHTVRLQFTVTVDTDHNDLWSSGGLVQIPTDLVYTGWRDRRDLGGMQMATISIGNLLTGNGQEQGVPPSCECESSNRIQCTCAKEQEDDVDIGMESATPWKYHKTLPGFGNNTRVVDMSGTVYTCYINAKSQRRQCVAAAKNIDGTLLWKKFPSIVDTLLGLSKNRHQLYGISQNGFAYVTSKDGGTTWYSIPSSLFRMAATSGDFLQAKLWPPL